MSYEWKTVNLLDEYEVRSGLSKPAKDFGSGYPFLSFKDVFYNYFTPTKLGDLVQSTAKERDSCSIKRGDLFLTRTSETMHELGMSCVALQDYPEATFNGFCKRLRPKSSTELVPEYVGYFFRSPSFRQTMLSMSTMSTRASLNNEMIARLQISYPPKAIQIEIAAILKSLDDRIALLRETNVTLEAMAQALFKSWFVDFDPVHANAVTQAPSLPPEIQALFPATFTDNLQGPIPEGWKVGSIADLGEVICGKTPATSEPLNYGSEVPFITIPDMHGKLVVTETARALSAMGANSQSKKFLRPGSICVSCIATPGLVVRVTEPSQTNQQINSVVPLPNWGDCYPLFALQKVGELVRAEGSGGSVFHNLNKSGFEKIPMLLPDEKVVIAFNNVAESLVAKITENQRQTQSLTQIRDTLLPRLISGQLRLPEIEMVRG